MPWIEVNFKGKQVWAECGADGTLVAKGGRTPVRYSDKPGAKVYSGGTSRIGMIPGARPVELEAGTKAGPSTKKKKPSAKQSAADVVKRVQELPEGTHLAFTDGACKGNPGPSGAGAVLQLANGEVLERAQSCGIATNNVGELTAIGLVLDMLEEQGVAKTEPVLVFTDSTYAINMLTKGWNAKANRVLIVGLRKRLGRWKKLELAWVPGHAGVPLNERADQLAVGACRR